MTDNKSLQRSDYLCVQLQYPPPVLEIRSEDREELGISSCCVDGKAYPQRVGRTEVDLGVSRGESKTSLKKVCSGKPAAKYCRISRMTVSSFEYLASQVHFGIT